MIDMNAPLTATPLKSLAENANTEHDAALSLFHLIAKTENWWGGDEGTPTRDEILACYADCVCAARGEPPVRTPQADVDLGDPVSEIIECLSVGETTGHCAAVYEAAKDLAGAQNAMEDYVIAPNDGVSLEA